MVYWSCWLGLAMMRLSVLSLYCSMVRRVAARMPFGFVCVGWLWRVGLADLLLLAQIAMCVGSIVLTVMYSCPLRIVGWNWSPLYSYVMVVGVPENDTRDWVLMAVWSM